jgi:FlaA1/EpsC-like NDP-sugar epimerase
LSKADWRRLKSLPRERWLRFLSDVGQDILACGLLAALAVYLVASRNVAPTPTLLSVLLSVAVIHSLVLFGRGVYSINLRYLGFHDARTIALACLPSATLLGVAEYALRVTGHRGAPTLLIVLYATLTTSVLLLMRLKDRLPGRYMSAGGDERRVLIVGAGDAGETLVRELVRHSGRNVRAIGFVDDDPMKQSMRIHGVPVLGRTKDIPLLTQELSINEIVMATPSATGEEMRRAYSLCRQAGVPVRTLPAVSGIFERGSSLRSQLREVSIEDLLRREPVQSNLVEVAQYVSGEHVLITGGGGSIGSELARQVARLNPACLVLVGKGENSLYEIEQELIQTTSIKPIVIVGDVRDEQAMEMVFRRHRPTVVFHAAAHKHVPLMQGNVREAVHNNIGGTMVVAQAAVRYGASKFILISTDKAVRPSSVMGATKRVCEMLATSFGYASETQFGVVRFGNVLGSRGSLVPLLQRQIQRGGPVTVTHPEMTRYFMTIPEAVQLVLEAGALGRSGEIFILDMGDPINIDELARELIWLHGLVPDDDIPIRYTGMRPGEKLHEELVYDHAELADTIHPKIRAVKRPETMDAATLKGLVGELVRLAEGDDEEAARQFLMDFAWNKLTPPMYMPYMS